jgi:uncharacterized repeat protein (TIGR02543 family)
MGESRRPRPRARKLGLLVVIASVLTVGLALAPGTNAGIAGNNTLTAQLAGTGNGNVSSIAGTPGGINCTRTGGTQSGVCTAQIPFGAPPEPYVGLQANPSAQSEFVSWSVTPADANIFGCGAQVTCYVQMNSNVTVTANFNSVPGFPVTVVKQGPAANQSSVTSNPAGINCTPTDQVDCSHSFAGGTSVTFTASPGQGATFGGWGGSCSAAGTNPVCTLGINQVTAITATFNIATQALNVTVTGDGGVSSNIQPGISCSQNNAGTCSFNFAQGSQVSLTAKADTGYTFTGWGGACANNANPCVVTMSQAQNVSATFVAAAVQASVTGNKVIYSTSNPKRVLQIKVNAQQTVNVKIQLQSGGETWASRTISGVDAGQSVLTLRIRNTVPAGRYTAVVTFTNSQGAPPLVQNRNVKLKAPPR